MPSINIEITRGSNGGSEQETVGAILDPDHLTFLTLINIFQTGLP